MLIDKKKKIVVLPKDTAFASSVKKNGELNKRVMSTSLNTEKNLVKGVKFGGKPLV